MFHKQITYALSFCKFEFSELAPFGDLQKSNRAYLDECRKVKEDDEELLRNIHILKQARKEKHERIERAKLRRDELKKKLEESLVEQKQQQERDAHINRETEMVKGEKEEALARLEVIKKKMVLYDKLLIKSPTRIKANIEKVDARIVELDKLIRSKVEEFEEQKKNVFDKEKFIENFRSCIELLSMFYENDVLSAK
jgi:chromosome segregation ATPase